MRKLGWTILALTLAGVGCTASEEKKVNLDAGKDGGGPGPGDGGGDPFPSCDVDSALGKFGPAGEQWTDPKPWTESEAQACAMKCAMQGLDCYEAMCPNGKNFVDCFLGEFSYCAAEKEKAPCRDELATIACCFDKEQCFTDEPGLVYSDCLEPGHACGPYTKDYGTCLDTITQCDRPALRACVRPDPDGGTGAGTDAGTKSRSVSRGAEGRFRALLRKRLGRHGLSMQNF